MARKRKRIEKNPRPRGRPRKTIEEKRARKTATQRHRRHAKRNPSLDVTPFNSGYYLESGIEPSAGIEACDLQDQNASQDAEVIHLPAPLTSSPLQAHTSRLNRKTQGEPQ
jgi:hypothetical protein